MSAATTDRARRGTVDRSPVGLRARMSEGFADVRSAVSHSLAVIALGVVICVGVVVLGWVSDPNSGAPWSQAVRIGAQLWLVAHLGDIAVVSQVATSVSPADPLTTVPGAISLAPLAVTLLAAWLIWRTGRTLAERCPPYRALALSPVVAGVHGAAAWLLAWSVDTAAAVPSPTACAVGAAVLAWVAVLAGVLSLRSTALLDTFPRPVANQLSRVVPAAAVAIAGWVLGGAVLLTIGLLRDLPTVAGVHQLLAPGVGGGVLLLLAQVAYLPTAVVWAASVLAGPGVGAGGSALSLSGSTVVDVPAIPLLAAFPAPGPFPIWVMLLPVAVVCAGGLAGWHAHRHPSSRGATLLDRLVDAVAVAALSGTAVVALCWVAAGALGPWQPLGPDLLMVGAAVTVEVLLGALLAGGALHLLAGRPVNRWRARSG